VPVAYLGVLTAAAWWGTRRRGPEPLADDRLPRVAVLVPAHDEERDIADAVSALLAADFPGDRLAVHVVADHCSDATADVARAAGATVHERTTGRPGKSGALRLGLEAVATAEPPIDVVAIVDADTLVAPGFVRAVVDALAGDAGAVQGHYGVRDPGASTGAGFRAAALALRHHLRPLGRTTLGASSGLFGNGMAFRRSALEGRDWSEHLTEDLRLQLDLVLDGVRIAYAPAARVEALMPATLDASTSQNERWERGRIEIARDYLAPLSRRAVSRATPNRTAVVDATLDVLVPPMSVLALAVAGVTASSVALRRWRGSGATGAWMPVVLVAHVASGLVLDHAPPAVYRSLLSAPRAVLWKAALFAGVVRRQDVAWSRTTRDEVERAS
jgi:cellulose synthase/poly-beta-1,6-N-acetylglucosamine synthase-like glycosyltransferase